MKQRSTLVGALVAVFCLAFFVPVSAGDLPSINGTMVFPNVFIVLDTSGSMNESPYRDGTSPVPVDTRKWKEWIDSSGSWGNHPSATSTIPAVNAWRRHIWDAMDSDGEVYFSGANHPASKFYQAKWAIDYVVSNLDNVNFGFATGMQERIPRVCGLYRKGSEFTWISTFGTWQETNPSQFAYINRDTFKVTPWVATNLGSQIMPPGDFYPVDWTAWNADEDRIAPLGTLGTFETLPQKFSTSFGTWFHVTAPTTAEINGKTVTVTPFDFDYYAIRYPNTVGAPAENKTHGWSYVHQVPTNECTKFTKEQVEAGLYGFSFQWWTANDRRDPYFPEDQNVDDYLGDEELTNFSNAEDDNIFFLHIPDPDWDDDPDRTTASRTKIKEFVSLANVVDFHFDCYVTDGPFCPNGGAGPGQGTPYRKFNSMPYTQSVACGGASPLKFMMRDAKRYFKSYFEQGGTNTAAECRESCLVLFIDSGDNCWANEFASAPEVVAAELLNLETNGVKTPVKTFVVAFGLSSGDKATADVIAAAGGTGSAYCMETLDDLLEKLQAMAPGASLTDSDPYFVSRTDAVVSIDDGEKYVYAGYLEVPGWKGHLRKFHYDSWRDEDQERETSWGDGADAGVLLSANDNRTIYTSIASSRTAFTTDNAAAIAAGGMSLGGFTSAEALITTIREAGKLGDIYHSTPVVIRGPRNADMIEADTSGELEERLPVVVVGTNYGMLHAFNDEDGQELWAYIPRCVLGNLHKLAAGHEYFVDLNMTAADMKFADGSWHTVLVGGLRQGGANYFALDITDTDDPLPLWEMTDGNLGETWSTPSFGRIKVNGNDVSVIFVGGGYSSVADVGNSLYIINGENGAVVKNFTNVCGSDEDILSEVKAVDYDKDGYIERVYVADTKGILYRLKLDKDPHHDAEPDVANDDPDDWAVQQIFDPADLSAYSDATKVVHIENNQAVKIPFADDARLPVNKSDLRQPVFFAPAVVKSISAGRPYLIYYGTGNEREMQNESSHDHFFEIEDRADGTVVCNWVLSLDGGEKILSEPATFNFVVYFTSYQPVHCGGGKGALYGLTMTRGDRIGGSSSMFLEDGMPVVKAKIGDLGIASSPQVVNGAVIVEEFGADSGDNEDECVEIFQIPEVQDQFRSWQEVY